MADFENLMRSALGEKMLDQERFSKLRQQIFNDEHVSITEADLVFSIDTQIQDKPEGWNDFFVNVITDFLIRQTLPVGYVDPIHATWLMERIDRDMNMSEETEQVLLLNVLRLAEDCPENLERYALNKVRDKIVIRATRDGLTITDDDVALMRKVLYASAGHGGFGISKTEAQFLFDLDEISQGQDNDPAWQKLFVGAIANHLLTRGAPIPTDPDEYRAAQEYLLSNRTIRWNIMDSFKAWRAEEEKSSFLMDHEAMKMAETIDLAEAKWLLDHLNRDGHISENEIALLKFIKNECPNIHEMLEPFMRQVA